MKTIKKITCLLFFTNLIITISYGQNVWYSSNIPTTTLGDLHVNMRSYLTGNVGIGGAPSTSSSYGLNMLSNIHMNNYNINYINQLHFNDNVRFYDEGNDNYLIYKYGDQGSGGIKFYDGDGTRQGYIYSDGDPLYPSFGLLDADGNWAIHIKKDNDIRFLVNNSEKLLINSNGRVELTGTDDATSSENTGVIEVANSLRIDGNEIITNSGTPLYLQNDNGGDLRVDNTTLIVDASTNRVGIGANPSYPLHVHGDIYADEGWLRVSNGIYNQTYGTYFVPADDQYWKSRTDRGILICNKAGDIQGSIFHNNDDLFGLCIGEDNWIINCDGDLTNLCVAGAPVMHLNRDGEVGIRTENPSYPLEVIGDIYANNGWFRASGSKGLYFQSHGGGFYMSDDTWIRTYGSKNFYHNTGIMRTDGTFQVGPSGNRFIVNSSGNVGIGITSPSYKLHLIGDAYITDNIYTEGGIHIGGSSDPGINNLIVEGNVGIGTTNPDCKLDVNGKIRAESLELIEDVPSSDYVFNEDYNLKSIEEIENFIQENKHLPGVPSADEFKTNGYNLGQMDNLLLKKIEELTIYIINSSC